MCLLAVSVCASWSDLAVQDGDVLRSYGVVVQVPDPGLPVEDLGQEAAAKAASKSKSRQTRHRRLDVKMLVTRARKSSRQHGDVEW